MTPGTPPASSTPGSGSARRAPHLQPSSRRNNPRHVCITEAPVGGEVGEPPGTQTAWRRPGVGPGSGLTVWRRPPRPGVDTHCPGVGPTGSNDSQFLKGYSWTPFARRTVRPISPFPRDCLPAADVAPRLAFVARQRGAHERRGRTLAGEGDSALRARGRRPGVRTHPASGRPGVGPGSARGRDSFGLRMAPVRHSL